MRKLKAPDGESIALQAIDLAFTNRLDRLRVRHLRLLDLVARHGSLSAASAAIGMSQPGATKMLQELEQTLACKLIERSATGGKLTPAGMYALDRMRIALHSIGTMSSSMDARKELPLIRLGIIPLVGVSALLHVVDAMHSENVLPRIQIQMGTVESLIQALSEGRVDCVVGLLDDSTTSNSTRKFNVMPLWDESLVMVCAGDHPLAACKRVSLKMVHECDWILMPKGSSNRRAVERLFQQAGQVPPLPLIETESFHIALSLVAGSRMLTACPESAYRQYQSQVKILSMEKCFAPAALVFVTLAGFPSMPSVELLAQRFQNYAQSVGRLKPRGAV